MATPGCARTAAGLPGSTVTEVRCRVVSTSTTWVPPAPAVMVSGAQPCRYPLARSVYPVVRAQLARVTTSAAVAGAQVHTSSTTSSPAQLRYCCRYSSTPAGNPGGGGVGSAEAGSTPAAVHSTPTPAAPASRWRRETPPGFAVIRVPPAGRRLWVPVIRRASRRTGPAFRGRRRAQARRSADQEHRPERGPSGHVAAGRRRTGHPPRPSAGSAGYCRQSRRCARPVRARPEAAIAASTAFRGHGAKNLTPGHRRRSGRQCEDRRRKPFPSWPVRRAAGAPRTLFHDGLPRCGTLDAVPDDKSAVRGHRRNQLPAMFAEFE
jgi:hypothetical protein